MQLRVYRNHEKKSLSTCLVDSNCTIFTYTVAEEIKKPVLK